MNPIPQSREPTDAPTLSSPSISDAIERLLANPELLSGVASAIGLGKPPQAASSAPPAPAEALVNAEPSASAPPSPSSAELAQAMATIAPLLSTFSGKGDLGAHASDPRSCLLRALKPYVNHNRAQAIDTILQLSVVSEAFKKLNGQGG